MDTTEARYLTRYKESTPLEVVGNPDWTSANGHSVEVQQVFPNGSYRVIAPRTGNITVLMHDELKPLTPRQVSTITTCEFGCCQAAETTPMTTESYAEIQKIIRRSEWDNYCNVNWQRFVLDNGPQKIPFIKALRDTFIDDEIGLKDAKDAVERCVPFTDAYNKYQTFRSVEWRVYETMRRMR
jgi:ribosomal protein L7/L12